MDSEEGNDTIAEEWKFVPFKVSLKQNVLAPVSCCGLMTAAEQMKLTKDEDGGRRTERTSCRQIIIAIN